MTLDERDSFYNVAREGSFGAALEEIDIKIA
jgi:hypothetical protein